IDFHGTNSTTATPTIPWATATQRPDAVPAATAPTPLANAISSAASRARLVIRGGGARMTGLAPGARHPAIGYLPCHAMAAQTNFGPPRPAARGRVTPGQVPGRGSLSDQEQAPRRRRTARESPLNLSVVTTHPCSALTAWPPRLRAPAPAGSRPAGRRRRPRLGPARHGPPGRPAAAAGAGGRPHRPGGAPARGGA